MWGVFLWAVISAFIIGTFLWSTIILFQQKRAWEAYAKKHKLAYEPSGLFGPPVIRGKIGENRFTFFTDVQKTRDVRGQRMVTVIEVEMGPGMPAAAAMASKEFREFIGELNLSGTFDPNSPDWKPDYVLQTRSVDRLKQYLTPERIKTLHSLFSMRNSVALFFFDTHEAVLRIETPDPLQDAVHMEKITIRLNDALGKLRPTDAEKEKWAAKS